MDDRDIAAAAHSAGLGVGWAQHPDEIATALGTASEQAVAIQALIVATPRPRDRLPSARKAFSAPSSLPDDRTTPLHRLSIAAIGRAFAAGWLDPPTLLAALLDRIAEIDPQLRSFVAIDPPSAHVAARNAAERWSNGLALGPLDGIPVAIKDVIDVAGLPTRCHSRVTDPAPVADDAAIVARLRAAGAVILGKLATHEFAIGGPAFDLAWPPARNPWNINHHPGGSSSGAGAAVAAGLTPLAIGTDTAGSVRNPASACGVVGLKPGRGVLPLDGVTPLAVTLDHLGLLTRSIEDMRIAAGALGMRLDAADGARVGYVRHFHTRDMTASMEIAMALDNTAARLGAVEATLPPLGDFALINRLILQAEGFAAHARHLRDTPELLSALTRKALLPGAFATAETLAAACRAREALTGAVEGALTQFDILLTASSMEPPCRIDDPAEIARTYMLQARSPFNVTGHPALTMPAGRSAVGLPLSVQLVARMGEEGRLLAVAQRCEHPLDFALQ
ncbi:amidase [Sphingomonas sp.]|uniref:amidase n=1 Tax=Sphingomonas sp. TaxID=28214 RepID=UPI003CC5EB66